MLVAYSDHCENWMRRHDGHVFWTSWNRLETSSEEWHAAEDLPAQLFLMDYGSYSGRVMSIIQRDEFQTVYQDEQKQFALIIQH